MKKKISIVALMGLIAGGCASTTEQVAVDPAMVRVAEAADNISRQMSTLAKVKSSQTQETYEVRRYEFNIDLFPERWRQEITLVEDYYGTIEDFVRTISAMQGFQEPMVLGVKPASPMMIAINKARRPVIEFIADAGYQAGEKVVVQPMVEQDKITLQYR